MYYELNKLLKQVLYTPEQISAMVERLGKEISDQFKGQSIFIVSLANGANMFANDLIRHIDPSINIKIDYMTAKSYEKNVWTGKIDIKRPLLFVPHEHENVIIVDDIYDTGCTLHAVINWFKKYGCKYIHTCVLLDKNITKKQTVKIDFVGDKVDDHFVFGYGLDIDESFRNLPYIGIADFDYIKSCESIILPHPITRWMDEHKGLP
jgi:hypoxanthine phosphoribosyltransferase